MLSLRVLTYTAMLMSSHLCNLAHARRADIEAVETDIDALASEEETAFGADSLPSLKYDSGIEVASMTGALEASANLSAKPTMFGSPEKFSAYYHPCELCSNEHLIQDSGSSISPEWLRSPEWLEWSRSNNGNFFWTYRLSWHCLDYRTMSGRIAETIVCTGNNCDPQIQVSVKFEKRQIVDYQDVISSSTKIDYFANFDQFGDFDGKSQIFLRLGDADTNISSFSTNYIEFRLDTDGTCLSAVVDRDIKVFDFLPLASERLLPLVGSERAAETQEAEVQERPEDVYGREYVATARVAPASGVDKQATPRPPPPVAKKKSSFVSFFKRSKPRRADTLRQAAQKEDSSGAEELSQPKVLPKAVPVAEAELLPLTEDQLNRAARAIPLE